MSTSVAAPTPAEGEPGAGAPPTPDPASAPPAAAPAKTRAELRAERQPGARRWHLRRWVLVGLALVLAAALAGVVVLRLGAPLPRAVVEPALTPAAVPGMPTALPWPATGEAALAIPALGVRTQSAAETPVPVASLTKVMTAYLILKDHPLVPGGDGPSFTMTAADAAAFANDSGQDQSSVPVAPGEVLTERQLLEGMLVHSANNFADSLAAWDGGSQAAFVAKMNAAAASLGMHDTHFADDSGYSTQSVSTPADMLKVATLALGDPAFAAAVALPSVTLPVAGSVFSYTPLIGTDNVVGVKSGFTAAAGGCDLLALHQVVAGQPVTVLAAVTGQQGADVLAVAGAAAHGLAVAAAAQIVSERVFSAGEAVARASTVGSPVPVVTTGGASVLAWPGQRPVRTLVVTAHPVAGTPAGAQVATAAARLGTQVVHVPARTAAPLPRPSVLQRLF